MGRGLTVGRYAVELLMRRAELQGLPGRRRRRPIHETPAASDLVDRNFGRAEPDRLWLTDITEHPTREGKVYCAVVLDTFSRRVVGWSIDSHQTASLVTSALSMAIDNRSPAGGTVIHSDHGTQPRLKGSSPTSWPSTRWSSRCPGPVSAGITPWPKASSPPTRPRSSTASPGPRGPRFAGRCSSSSRSSRTASGCTPRWASSAPPSTRPRSTRMISFPARRHVGEVCPPPSRRRRDRSELLAAWRV
jgi:Integrase core domain